MLNQLVLLNGGPARYRYIGMGSVAFMDFQLFHRVVGLENMLSIEHEQHAERAEFNKPLACIEVVPGDVHDVLPTLDLTGLPILWLDYDGKLKDRMVDDVAVCARVLEKGAVLMVTVNCESGNNPRAETDLIRKLLDRSRIPTGFSARNLKGWDYAKFIRSTLTAELEAEISVRNKGKAPKDRLLFRQFMFFTYRDNARMCTLGWVFDTENGNNILESSKLDELEAYRPGEDHFLIKPPVITPVETRHVNRQLPSVAGTELTCPGLSESELKEYAKLYRHYPVFYEVTEA